MTSPAEGGDRKLRRPKGREAAEESGDPANGTFIECASDPPVWARALLVLVALLGFILSMAVLVGLRVLAGGWIRGALETVVYMLAFGASLTVGAVLAGKLSRWLRRRAPRVVLQVDGAALHFFVPVGGEHEVISLDRQSDEISARPEPEGEADGWIVRGHRVPVRYQRVGDFGLPLSWRREAPLDYRQPAKTHRVTLPPTLEQDTGGRIHALERQEGRWELRGEEGAVDPDVQSGPPTSGGESDGDSVPEPPGRESSPSRSRRATAAVLFVVGGLLLMGWNLWTAKTALALSLGGTTTQGQVLSLDEHAGRRGSDRWYSIAFSYEDADGRVRQARHKCSRQLYHRLGLRGPVKVVYGGGDALPAEDLLAFHLSDASLWSGAGLLLLGLGAWELKAQRGRRTAAPRSTTSGA